MPLANYRRKIAWLLLAVVGGLLVIGGGLLFLVRTAPARQWALDQLTKALLAQGIGLNAERLDLDPLALRARLHNATFFAVDKQQNPLAKVGSIEVSLAFTSGLFNQPSISSILIDKPVLLVVVDAAGGTNLPVLKPRDPASKSISIGVITIQNAALRVDDRQHGIRASIPEWSGTIEQLAEETYRIQIDSKGASDVEFEGRRTAVSALDANLVYGPKRIDIASAHLKSGNWSLSGSGSIEDLKTLDLRFESAGELDDVARAAGVGGRARGKHEAKLSIKGTTTEPSASGELELTDAWLDNQGPFTGSANGAWDAKQERVTVSGLIMRWDRAQIDGGGEFGLKTGSQSSVNIRFRNVGSQQVAAAAGVKIPIATSATGSANLSFPFPIRADRVNGTASVRFTESPPARNQQAPLSGDARVRAQNGVVELQLESLRSLGVQGEGRVELRPGNQLAGQLRIATTDLDATLSEARKAGFSIEGFAPGTVRGPVQISANLNGTASSPVAYVNVSSNGLSVANSLSGSLNANARVQKDRVELRDLRFADSGQALLTATGVYQSNSLDFSGELTHPSLRALLRAAGTADTPYLPDGAVHGTFRAGGTASRPTVTATIDSPGITALHQPLGNFRADLDYSGDTLSIRQFALARNGGGISGQGRWNRQSKEASAQASISNYRLDSLQLPDGTPVRMRLDGKVASAGTVDVPQITADLAATDILIRDVAAKRATVQGSLTGQQLNARLAVPDWGAKVDLAGPLDSSSRSEARVELARAPIEVLLRDFTGAVSATGQATFLWTDPLKTVEAAATIQSLNVRRTDRTEEVRVSTPAAVRFDGKFIDLESLTITAGPGGEGSSAVVSGRIPVDENDRSGSVRLQADLDLASLPGFVPQLNQANVGGRLTTDIVLTGGGKQWQPEGRLDLTDGSFAHASLPAPLTDIRTAIDLRNGNIEITQAAAKWLTGTITATGRIPFELVTNPDQPASQPFSLRTEVSGLKLETLPGALEKGIAGETSFFVSVSGQQLDPQRWTGEMETSALKLRIAQADFEQKTPLRVTLRDMLLSVANFELAGPESSIGASGSVSLRAPNPVAMNISGNINAAIAQLFTDQVRAEGDTKIALAVTGTLNRPRLRGSLDLAGLQGEIPSIQALFENVNGKVVLNGQHLEIPAITGDLNGGTLKLTGNLDLEGTTIGSLEARLEAKGTSWAIPEGLETAADLDLRLIGDTAGYRASGSVRILDGSYRESLVLERGLFRSLGTVGSSSAAPLDTNRTPVELDIQVSTVDPILVENELLNGEITANLRVMGDTDRPALVGRLDIVEGANFYLGGRNYLIDRGAVTFTNQTRIEPTLDVRGHTKAGGFDITLQAQGTVGEKLQTTFTSDPPLSEANIISVLVSGRQLRDLRGAEGQVAQDQALSYLSGNLASTFSQQANRALGVNFVRIDPGLIADEAEPTARLTLGQDITNRLGLVYSVNLRNSADQIWVGRFDLTRRFQTRAVRQSDNSFRFQFQHDVELGGTPAPESQRKQRVALPVGEIQFRFEGPTPIPEEKLRSKLGIKIGKPFEFLRFRKGIDKIKEELSDAGHPEARVRSTREEKDGKIVLSVLVNAGPRVNFVYEGFGISRSARSQVREVWARSTFDSLRTRQAVETLRKQVAKEGYPAATVESLVRPAGPSAPKRVIFTIERGKKYRNVEILFPGSGFEKELLAVTVPDKDARIEASIQPERLKAKIEQFYQSRGFLDVKTGAPSVEQNGRFRVAIPVTEGPQVVVGEVLHTGNHELTSGKLYEAARIYQGQPYDTIAVESARTRVEDALATLGLTGSEVKVESVRKGEAVDLTFRITEGRKRVVSEIAVEGNQHVDENLVRAQIGVKPGDVLTDAKLNEARRNLYATGAFSLADVEAQDLTRAGSVAPARLTAKLREVRPFEVRYGVLFDTERGPGGIFDVSARNVLGSARVAGIRGRYDSRLQEARTYFEQPSLLQLPLKFVTTGFLRRELNDTFVTDRTGGSSYLEYRWGKPYLFNFGYRFEQVHTFEREPDPLFPFDVRLRIAPLTAGFARDTRDQLLDATRGSFTSHIAEWAPSTLGSQLQFAKYFGQYFYYRALNKPTVVPWTGERRSRLIYAGGVRYGLAGGLSGQELIPSERFYAGGSNSVRGFVQDRLGPLAGSSALGGESLFIVNNELRFPLFKFVDGVGFMDAGQVYERWQDFRFGDIRYTSGVGLRVRTPYFLLRFDYGKPFGSRPGDPRNGRFYFGIGQAF